MNKQSFVPYDIIAHAIDEHNMYCNFFYHAPQLSNKNNNNGGGAAKDTVSPYCRFQL